MKRWLAFLVVLSVLTLPARAYTPALSRSGDYYYIIDRVMRLWSSQIYSYEGDAETVEVPAAFEEPMDFVRGGCFKERANLRRVVLPDAPLGVMSGAFTDCPRLESVVLPNAIVLSGNAFFNCPALRTFEFDAENPRYRMIEGALCALDAMRLLTPAPDIRAAYNVPEGILALGECAFYHREDLVAVILPETLSDIGGSAFEGCAALTSVNLEGTALKSVGLLAFRGCGSLTEVTLPEGVETIANGAFAGCASLRRVRLPASVREIGKSAFYDDPQLVLSVPAGSMAMAWAEAEGVPFIIE